MHFASAFSRAAQGMAAPQVRVEAHLGMGLPSFNIVGLPETAVRESRDRVRSAITNAQYSFPSDRRVTVNLAPADLPKSGGRFDLPIALAILGATGQLDAAALEGTEFLAELSLDGHLRPVRGALLAAAAAASAGRPIVVAAGNAIEAALPEQARALAADRLEQVVQHLSGGPRLEAAERVVRTRPTQGGTLTEIRGHHGPKRALLIAASGGHNLLMHGPPGTGKTLLARCLPNLLPPLSTDEALEVAAIHSLAGRLGDGLLPGRPFRAPHHSATAAALVGGGSDPLPGEVSLAHLGVLFLDELPEFARSVLENLREPLESGNVVIARARARAEFPAGFQLVAAMNPCPAGRDCRGGVSCVCSGEAQRRYQSRLSAPLLDRIDLQVEVAAVPVDLLAAASRNDSARGTPARGTPAHGTSTQSEDEDAIARARVCAARKVAIERQGVLNARLGPRATERICRPDREGLALLERAASRMGMSARGWHRTLRVARTLADMNGRETISRAEIAEALAFREQFGTHHDGAGVPASASNPRRL